MFLQGILYGIVGMFGWGTSDFFSAVTSKRIGNTKAQFWSLVIGLILFGMYAIFTKQQFSFSHTFLIKIAFTALLQVSGTFFFLKAFQIGKVSLVSPLASSFGMWTSIFALIFLHEHITLVQAIAISMILLGIFITSTNIQELRKNARFVTSDKGVRFALLASILWAISFTMYSPIVKADGWFVSVVMLRIFMILFLTIFLLIRKQSILFPLYRKNVLPSVSSGFLDVVGYAGYTLALTYGLTAIVSPITAAFPIVTIACAQIFLKERLAKEHISGIALIILGLILLAI